MGASICSAKADADTQLTVFESSASEKQLLSAPSKFGASPASDLVAGHILYVDGGRLNTFGLSSWQFLRLVINMLKTSFSFSIQDAH